MQTLHLHDVVSIEISKIQEIDNHIAISRWKTLTILHECGEQEFVIHLYPEGETLELIQEPCE